MYFWTFFTRFGVFLIILSGCRIFTGKTESQSLNWSKGKITNAKVTVEKEDKRSHSFKIPLSVIRNKESSWNNSELRSLIKETEKIFEQCSEFGINLILSPITLIELNHPLLNELHYKDDYLFTQDLPKNLIKPVAVFTEKSKYSWGGYANRAEVLKDEKKKISYGFVFILRGSTKHREGKYNYFYRGILAHEIAYILLEEEPNDLEKNILNHNLEKGGTKLTKSQCEKIKKHPLVSKK